MFLSALNNRIMRHAEDFFVIVFVSAVLFSCNDSWVLSMHSDDESSSNQAHRVSTDLVCSGDTTKDHDRSVGSSAAVSIPPARKRAAEGVLKLPLSEKNKIRMYNEHKLYREKSLLEFSLRGEEERVSKLLECTSVKLNR